MRPLVRPNKEASVPIPSRVEAIVPRVEHNVGLNRAFYDDALYEP